MESPFNFFSEDIQFAIQDANAIIEWLTHLAEAHTAKVEQLNYVFCSDEFLYEMNVKYLDHDTYTDIITFPMNDNPIEGDIFISIDRVKENAELNKVSFENELHRVMAHGLLHLIGFNDKTEEEQAKMTEEENKALVLRF